MISLEMLAIGLGEFSHDFKYVFPECDYEDQLGVRISI